MNLPRDIFDNTRSIQHLFYSVIHVLNDTTENYIAYRMWDSMQNGSASNVVGGGGVEFARINGHL